jgi:hypothetical protein
VRGVRLLTSAALLAAASSLGASATSAGAPARQVEVSAPPVQPAVALPKLKAVPPMKAMRAGSTAKDFQEASAQQAAASGQAYAVDSSAFAPGRTLKSNQPAGDIDVPDYFTYLTLQGCQDDGADTKMDQYTGAIGRYVNHWQWCGWDKREAITRDTQNGSVRISGVMTYRLTMMGWGSQSSNEITVRVFVDQVNTVPGSVVTPGNTTVTIKPKCEWVYSPGTCTFSNPAPSDEIIDLAAGGMIELKVNVGLPAATSTNPDRLTGLNLSVQHVMTTTAAPGQVEEKLAPKPLVRCDAAVQGGEFTKPACIFSGVAPYWALNTNDSAINEVAAHVMKAQNDPDNTAPPYPGGHKIIPKDLHRTTDSLLNEAQRSRATYQCRKWLRPVPPDDSCDEYPFASTYEGSFNEPETNYSVAAVNAARNSLEGSRRGTWYKADRILENDRFGVVPYTG